MDNTALIVEGISRALFRATKYPCYVDFKKHKAQFPCFYIELIATSQELEYTNRYWREHDFAISLFMNEFGELKDSRALQNIADTLFISLEYIDLGDNRKIRGTDMNYRITDNILHFFVSYDLFITKELEKIPTMQTLTATGRIKNNGTDD